MYVGFPRPETPFPIMLTVLYVLLTLTSRVFLFLHLLP
jgi:hypothetical protein